MCLLDPLPLVPWGFAGCCCDEMPRKPPHPLACDCPPPASPRPLSAAAALLGLFEYMHPPGTLTRHPTPPPTMAKCTDSRARGVSCKYMKGGGGGGDIMNLLYSTGGGCASQGREEGQLERVNKGKEPTSQ